MKLKIKYLIALEQQTGQVLTENDKVSLIKQELLKRYTRAFPNMEFF